MTRLLLTASAILFVLGAWAQDIPKFDWDPASRLKGEEKDAWGVFIWGVAALKGRDRQGAAKFFEKVAKKYPKSSYAADSKELAELLGKMIKEEAAWKDAKDPSKLAVDERIKYWVYHLRYVNCRQIMQPGMCYLVSKIGQVDKDAPNAAIELRNIGEPAIPALIELLEDRRPTCSVGYWRDFAPSRTILRYQDAAIQILNELLPAAFYRRNNTAAYFSTEDEEVREKTIKAVKAWYAKCKDKTPVERKWLALEQDIGIYPSLHLLEELATKHKEKKRALKALREMAKKRPPIQLPQISLLMCRLGDESKLKDVIKMFENDKYGSNLASLPDDSAASTNAESHAIEQIVLFAGVEYLKANRKMFSSSELFSTLSELATEEYEKLPAGYPRDRFPIQLLIEFLDDTQAYSHTYVGDKKWTIRCCDRTAETIQLFTGETFGYTEESSVKERDAAITKIKAWWKTEAKRRAASRQKKQ